MAQRLIVSTNPSTSNEMVEEKAAKIKRWVNARLQEVSAGLKRARASTKSFFIFQ